MEIQQHVNTERAILSSQGGSTTENWKLEAQSSLRRVGEHLYWMGRYLERAEYTSRALECGVQSMSLPGRHAAEAWDELLAMFDMQEEFVKQYNAPSTADRLHFVLFDPENTWSVSSTIWKAHEHGRAASTVLSTDARESLNALWLDLNGLDQFQLLAGSIMPCLVRVKEGARQVHGALAETSVSQEAADLIAVGTMLERADFLVRLLQNRMRALSTGGEQDEAVFYASAAVLQMAGAVDYYRTVYRDVITPWRVIDLLVLHPTPPCTLRNCLDRITDGLAAGSGNGGGEAARLAVELRCQLHDIRTSELLRLALSEQLSGFTGTIQRLGAAISQELGAPWCA